MQFNNLLKNTAKEEFQTEIRQQEQKKLNQKNFNTLSKELNKTFKLNEREQNIENKQKYIFQILKYQDSLRFGDFVIIFGDQTDADVNFRFIILVFVFKI